MRQAEFIDILDRFSPFTPLATIKIKILKKQKNVLRYYHLTQVYRKLQSYDIWFPRYQAWQTEFFCHFGLFFAFLPPDNPKYENFEKMKKAPVDVIILHIFIINDNHMMYDSWDSALYYKWRYSKNVYASNMLEIVKIFIKVGTTFFASIFYVLSLWGNCPKDIKHLHFIFFRWGTHLYSICLSVCCALYFRNHTSCDQYFLCTCVKW